MSWLKTLLRARGKDACHRWAEVLEAKPDASIVTHAELRAGIERTGLPWRVRDRVSSIELLLVPPGKYQRGASPGDDGAFDREKPAHEVTITKAFYLGRYEVTQNEWKGLMSSNPSHFSGDDRCPVEKVSFDDIQGFLVKARGLRLPGDADVGVRDLIGFMFKVRGLRLPTEAEWEYACRAGTTGACYGDLSAVAWHGANSSNKPHPVGEKAANALGLYDMLGNVSEWCAGWSSDWNGGDEYKRCSCGVVDPTGPSSGTARVLRGGSWTGGPRDCRSSHRVFLKPGDRTDIAGFRVARTT